MIKLIFSRDRHLLNFIIINKEIYYTDRVWKSWIRILPKDERLIAIIRDSRNKIPAFIKDMFNLSKEEMEEYNKSKDEREIMNLIIKDAKLNGCLLIDSKIE